MDGIEYHAETVTQDLLDRMLMIRSGQVRVWTLSWRDLDPEDRAYLNPLAEPALSPAKIGPLGRVLAAPAFALHADRVRGVQAESSLQALRRLLDSEMEGDVATRSILIRALVAMGRSLEQLPRQAAVSDEGREFLLTPGLAEHVGAGPVDLYMACTKISPSEWAETEEDIRLLLRAELPAPGEDPAAKALYTEAWRGLWRLVNLLQAVRGLHVELSGLDTLSPPDMTAGGGPTDADTAAWTEARALCDEDFHPLIDALIAAELPGPDHIGDDIVADGRVVGTMEFGWSGAQVGVIEQACEGSGWTLVPFDPDTDQIGETVTRILQAIQETKS